jgi:prolipoprotein diacylglyceryl transferase
MGCDRTCPYDGAVLLTVASIPSPDSGTIEIGPVPLHAYGLLLAVGILVAAWIGERRWVAKGHTSEEFSKIAIWTVIGGIVGARLYHVATDYQLFTDDWFSVVKIWEGGLSIWGAVGGGAIVLAVLCWRFKLDFLDLADSVAPGLAMAQAIGRWGNWFNQELFGRPTDLPWGLEIDPANRPSGYENDATFQPTFLYESIYNLAVFGALLWVERRFTLRKGQLFALYIAFYTFGRFFVENLRIDDAHDILGMRVNAWVSVLIFAGAIAWFLWLGRHRDQATPAGLPLRDEPASPEPV